MAGPVTTIRGPVFFETMELGDLLGNYNIIAGVQLLVPAQVHGLVEQRHHVRVEGLPVGVLKVVFLALLAWQTD